MRQKTHDTPPIVFKAWGAPGRKKKGMKSISITAFNPKHMLLGGQPASPGPSQITIACRLCPGTSMPLARKLSWRQKIHLCHFLPVIRNVVQPLLVRSLTRSETFDY